MNTLQPCHKKFTQANSLDKLSHELKRALKNFGLSTFAFTHYHSNTQNNKIKFAVTTDDYALWHQHYHDHDYENIDTTGDQLRHMLTPMFWSIDEQLRTARTQREKQLRNDSIAFGIECGLSVPLHAENNDFAILMVLHQQGENCLEHHETLQYQLLSLGYCYFERLRQLLKQQQTPCDYGLNSRQLQCLRYLHDGLNVEQIAAHMNISKRTVNYHLHKINKALGVKNKYLAVAKAREQAIID